MWVRLGTFNVKDGQGDAMVKVHKAQVLDHVRKQPGLVANFLLQPVKPGEPFAACTVWQTRAHGEAYEQSGAAGAVVKMLGGFMAGPPSMAAYETESFTLPANAS